MSGSEIKRKFWMKTGHLRMNGETSGEMYKDINSEEIGENEKTKTEKNSSDVYCDALSWTDTPGVGCPSS